MSRLYAFIRQCHGSKVLGASWTFTGTRLWCLFEAASDYVADQDGDQTKQMKLGEAADGHPIQTPERARAIAEA